MTVQIDAVREVPTEPQPIGPPPPFDAQLVERLRTVKQGRPSLTMEGIGRSRAAADANRLSDDDIRALGFDVQEYTAPGPTGAPNISLLVCRPHTSKGPIAAVYNIHGGGMVAGHYRTDELAGELRRAAQLDMAIVAVNYRLAPENPDPAPVEDCYAGLCWAVENAALLGLDSNRVVISGNSAGGGLAAGVALLCRDRRGPKLLGQMLQCPMLDDRCDTPSARQMTDVGLWDTISNRTGWTALLGDRRGGPDVGAYAAPARAADLSGLPPTFVDVGAVEALRDEAVQFASRIWRCGGSAELHVWSGAFHCFDQWVPDAIVSRAADQVRVEWLRRLLVNESGRAA